MLKSKARHSNDGDATRPIAAPASVPEATAGCGQAAFAPSPALPDLVNRLAQGAPRGDYSAVAAYALSVASAWAYSKPETLEEVMRYIGFENDRNPVFHGGPAFKTIRNDALLVQTTATLLQDSTGKVAILCFRGTEPTNALTWLADATFEMDRFSSWGKVHSGFHRSLLPIWPFIACGLDSAVNGLGIPRCDLIAPGEQVAPSPRFLGKLEALYICGHSLGAALAVLAAAKLHEDPRYACIREKLRGVYTYGTPRVGDEEFAATCEKQFGDILFRHIYGTDIVARFPPRLYGAFSTFGQEYVSTPTGWTHRRTNVKQTYTLLASTLLATFAWVAKQVPVLREIRMPLSVDDHSPIHYMRCSRLSLPFPR